MRGKKARSSKAFLINGIGVILRGYLYLTRKKIPHGVISASVAELQLIGFRAVRKRYYLMTKTDAENDVFSAKRFHRFDNLGYVGGITRAVRYKYTVGRKALYHRSGGIPRSDGNGAAAAV